MLIEIKDVQDPNVKLSICTDEPLDMGLIAISLDARRGFGWFDREEVIRALIALGEKEVE